MRKILSEEETLKKEKVRNTIISIILLGILLFSTVGFAFLYNSDSTTSTGTSQSGVQSVGDKWVLDYSGQSLAFSESPNATKITEGSIIVSLAQFSGKPLYIDSESEAVYSEIAYNLGRYTERTQNACYDNCENSSWPEKSCATDSMIVYRQKEKNHIAQDGGCVLIEGDMRAVDSFLYKIFGVN